MFMSFFFFFQTFKNDKSMLFTMIFFIRKIPLHNFSFLFQNCREKKIKQKSEVRKPRKMLGVCKRYAHSEAVYRTHVFSMCCITFQILDVIANMLRLLHLFVCWCVYFLPWQKDLFYIHLNLIRMLGYTHRLATE